MAENRVEGSSAAKLLNAGMERKAAGKSSDAEFSFLLKEAYGKSQRDMSDSLLNSRAKNSTAEPKAGRSTEKPTEAASEQKMRKSEKKEASEKDSLSKKSAEGEQELGMMSLLLSGQQEAASAELLTGEEGLAGELTEQLLEGVGSLPEGVEVLPMAAELLKDGAGLGEELPEQHIELEELSEAELAAGTVQAGEQEKVLFEKEESAPSEELISKPESSLEQPKQSEQLPDSPERGPLPEGREETVKGISERGLEKPEGEKAVSEEDSEEESVSPEQAGIHAQQLGQRQEIRRENPEELPKELLSTSEAKLQEDISELMAARIQNLNRGELLIELEPKNLGQIVLRINYVGAQARVSLFAENPKTWEILSQNAQEMAHIIEEKTGTMTAVLIERQEEQGDLSRNMNGEGSGENKERAEEELEKQLRERQQRESGDFLQQLRLGLV